MTLADTENFMTPTTIKTEKGSADSLHGVLDRISLACAESICYELGAELNAVRIRRVLEPLHQELQEISAYWRSLAADRWHRADEWVSGDPTHAARVAEATCLEQCAKQLDAALRSNADVSGVERKP